MILINIACMSPGLLQFSTLPFAFVGHTNGPEAEPHHRHAASPGFSSARGPGQQQIISERQQQRQLRVFPPQQHPAHLRAADSTGRKRG